MLKGVKKNFNENYTQIINLKKKEQLRNKEDDSVSKA